MPNMDIDKKKIVEIMEKYGVKKAALFGSFARGEDNQQSDVDILVELPEGSTLLDLAGLKIDLQNTLGRDVDLLTYNSINPYRRDNILKSQVSIV